MAEQPPALKAGSIVADPLHLAAMWKLSLQNAQAPPPRWRLTFDPQVQATPLLTYQEVSQ